MVTEVRFLGKSELDSMIKLKRNNISSNMSLLCRLCPTKKEIVLVCDLKENLFVKWNE